jgi:hypothetical protein
LKAFSSGEPGWHEMIMEMLNKQRLMINPNDVIKFFMASRKNDKTKLDELERRIKYFKDKASG